MPPTPRTSLLASASTSSRLPQSELEKRWFALTRRAPVPDDVSAGELAFLEKFHGVPALQEVDVFTEDLLRVGDDVEFSSVQCPDNKRGTLHMLSETGWGRMFVLEHRVQGNPRAFRPSAWQVRRVYRSGAEVLRKRGLTLPPVPLPVFIDGPRTKSQREALLDRSMPYPTYAEMAALPSPIDLGFEEGDVVAVRGKRRNTGKETKFIVMKVLPGYGKTSDVLQCRYKGHSERLPIPFADVRKTFRHHYLVAIRPDVRDWENG